MATKTKTGPGWDQGLGLHHGHVGGRDPAMAQPGPVLRWDSSGISGGLPHYATTAALDFSTFRFIFLHLKGRVSKWRERSSTC